MRLSPQTLFALRINAEMNRWIKEADAAKRAKVELENENQMRLDEIGKQITTLDFERSEELERERDAHEQEKLRMQEDYEKKLDREREKFEKLAAEKAAADAVAVVCKCAPLTG